MSLCICCDKIDCFNTKFWVGLLNAVSLPLTKIKTRLSAHIQCRKENGYNLMIILHLIYLKPVVLTSIGLWAKIQPQSTSGGFTELSTWLPSPSFLLLPPPLPSAPVSELSSLADRRINSCKGGEERGGTRSSKARVFQAAYYCCR